MRILVDIIEMNAYIVSQRNVDHFISVITGQKWTGYNFFTVKFTKDLRRKLELKLPPQSVIYFLL